MAQARRQERQQELAETIRRNPFLSDEELARRLGVSVQTIRLDRLSLGIPELRERTKAMAEQTYGTVRAMAHGDIVGELIDLELGQQAISVLETSEAMVFERSRVVRGQELYAQAESLAIAVIDAETALTGLANVKFKRSVRVGEKLVAKAQVIRRRGSRSVVLVETRSHAEVVFRAKFVVFALPDFQPGREGSGEGVPR